MSKFFSRFVPGFASGALVGLVLGLSIVVAGFAYLKFPLSVANWLPSINLFDSFSSEQITYRFRNYAATITDKQSLYVARLEQIEVFERTSQASYFWMRLPDVIARAEVPVQYNYSVSLRASWSFERIGSRLLVFVPELSSSAPAPNISAMKIDILKGSFLRNEKSAKEALLRELNGLFIENAINQRGKVREQARTAIKEFVGNWLSSSGMILQPIGVATAKNEFQEIEIRFPDEAAISSDPKASPLPIVPAGSLDQSQK